jgi:hypothetical protein
MSPMLGERCSSTDFCCLELFWECSGSRWMSVVSEQVGSKEGYFDFNLSLEGSL